MGDMEEVIRKYYRGELAEAEEIVKRILLDNPGDIPALVRYAAIQKDLGRPEEAGAIYLRLAATCEREGNYEECLEFLEQASSICSREQILPLKGRCLFYLGRYGEALDHFSVFPGDSRNLYYTGRIYAALQKHDKALQAFRKILDNASNAEEMFRASYWIGKSLFALGELEEAAACFTSYLSYYPGEGQVYLDLALCCLNLGRLEQSKEHLRQYQNSGGSQEVANFYLGIAEYRTGDYREAIDRFERITHHQALHWKGLAHYELGQYEEALKSFSSAVAHEAKPTLYKMMGNAHLKQGRCFEAKICYEKALSLDASDEDLKKLLDYCLQVMQSEEC